MFASWGSYPKIYALGHRAVKELTNLPVFVQEKVDGSQFSFGVDPDSGELKFRSKGADIMADCPEGMFVNGVQAITEIKDRLTPGWTYRGEYLQKPKHNALAYNNTPTRHVILFDINTGDQEFLSPDEVLAEGARIGLEVVRTFFTGVVTLEMIQEFLTYESALGGQKIEGVVLKPVGYNLFGEDKKVILGKFVSEHFKEIHHGEWKAANPSRSDIVQVLINGLRTPARWDKAIQHLREAGILTDSPKDIGPVMKEVVIDTKTEAEEEVKEALFKYFWPQIQRGLTAGLPEYYKEKLLASQFE